MILIINKISNVISYSTTSLQDQQPELRPRLAASQQLALLGGLNCSQQCSYLLGGRQQHDSILFLKRTLKKQPDSLKTKPLPKDILISFISHLLLKGMMKFKMLSSNLTKTKSLPRLSTLKTAIIGYLKMDYVAQSFISAQTKLMVV